MKLLVSVLSANEALAALSAGADILDVKNPLEGSLGSHTPAVIRQIRSCVPRPHPISVALGDVPNLPGTVALAALGAAVCGADYLKVGLWGPKTQEEAIELLRRVREAIADFPAVSVIAAGYADASRIGTLNPKLLPRIARISRVAGCLLDTGIKDGRSLFDFLDPESLRALAYEAHDSGLIFALAGSLRAEDLPLVKQLGADIAGVRSAVCRDGRRDGPLGPERVRHLRQMLNAS